MARRYVIGVDLGTSGSRTVLAGTDGRILGHETARTALHLLPGGGAEQDPDDWWRAIRETLRRLLDRRLVPVSDIAAICLSAQWGGTVAVDAEGRHLHRALLWMDGRGAEHTRRLAGGGLRVPGTGYNATRLRAWIARSGGAPTLTGKDPVGQSQFLRHARPDVFARAAHLLDVPEYLTMRLTGRPVAGHDTVALRWCTDNRTPGAVRYDERLVRLSGLPRDRLPALVEPATVVGPILPAAAAELGLGEHVLVAAGTGDTTAAAIGAGAVLPYQGHLCVGTSAWLSCHVPRKKTDVLHNVAALPSVVPDSYWVATIQDVAGKGIDWLIGNVLGPEGRDPDAAGEDRDELLARLNRLAGEAPPGSNGVVFTPWLNGERTPVDDPTVRGGWFNVSLTTTRADLARSTFEGIALNARWLNESVERFTGRPFPHLNFIGGGATSPLWCQAMADVLGRTIRQVAEPALANARGAALIAAVALGELDWSDIPEKVAIAAEFTPDPANRPVYDRAYAAFRSFYRHNRGIYAALNGRPPARPPR
ncbi:xylulokinase [Streptomyces hainanensis]|uniref:xylulokinase n=1 Tax=Streptomyces hainanensis TaxID=402648 RepID=UPI001A9E34C8|nr:FGGY-family carbohydrate kinase [Streptomyces hainanensis]